MKDGCMKKENQRLERATKFNHVSQSKGGNLKKNSEKYLKTK